MGTFLCRMDVEHGDMMRSNRTRQIESRRYTWEIGLDRRERRGEFSISTDPSDFDVSAIHVYLSASYWAAGIPQETVARSIANSLCFGVFNGEAQIGFARVITDRATFAYIGDVYILDAFQGRGLGTWLMQTITAHPDLQGLRRWSLVTRDAHGLYRRFGFDGLKEPAGYMEKSDITAYREMP
jgi:GNAT superfamily N-acetyltransferase